MKTFVILLLFLTRFQFAFSQLVSDNLSPANSSLKDLKIDMIDSESKRDIFAKYKNLFLLHYYSKTGCDDSVKYFIKKGYYVNNQTQKKDSLTGGVIDDMSPLMYASEAGFISTCKLLILFGADPYQKNSKNMSAIDIAKAKKNLTLVRFLTKKEFTGLIEEKDFVFYINNARQTYEKGEYIISNACANYALNLMNLQLTKDNHEFLNVLMILVDTYQKIGNFAKSEEYLNDYINFCEKHLDQFKSEYYLSVAKMIYLYNKIGNFEKSKILLEILQSLIIKNNNYYEKNILSDAFANYYLELGDRQNAEKWFNESLNLKKTHFGETSYEYGITIIELFRLYNQKPIKFETENEDSNEIINRINNSKYAFDDLKNFFSSKVLGRFKLSLLKKITEVIRIRDGEFSQNYLKMLLLLDYCVDKTFTTEIVEDNKDKIFRINMYLNNHPSTYQRGLVYFPPDYDLITQNKTFLIKNKINYYEELKSNIEKTYGTNNSAYLCTIDSLLVLFKNNDKNKFYETIRLKEIVLERFEPKHSFSNAIENLDFSYNQDKKKENEDLKRFLIDWAKKNEIAVGLLCDKIMGEKLKNLNIYRKYLKRIVGSTNDFLDEYDAFLKENKISRDAINIDRVTQGKELLRTKLFMDSILSKIPNASIDGSEKKYRDFFQLNEFSWKMIRDILKQNEVAIEYFYVNNSKVYSDNSDVEYYAIIIKPNCNAPVLKFLFNEKDLKAKLKQPMKNGNNKNEQKNLNRGKPMSINIAPKDNYNIYWKPLEESFQNIDSMVLYYSPTGLLNNISFASISKPNGEFLSKKISFRYLSTLLNIFEPRSPFQLHEKTEIAIISNPNTCLPALDTLERNIVYDFAKSKKALIQLFTKKEASITNFKKIGSQQKSPDIIHMTTHGEYLLNNNIKENPLFNSVLYLDTAYHISDNYFGDGILTAATVSNYNFLNTKLVVLSSCESSLGRIIGDEGVFGLPRAFRAAGAEYILASLWKIPDRETTVLMRLFYNNLSQCGYTKDCIPKALENAQKVMREMGYSDDSWGGFILIR